MLRSTWAALPVAFGLLAACGSDDSAASGSGGTAGQAGDAGGAAGAGGGAAGSGGSGATDASADAPGEPGALLGSFQLTYYWVTTEDEYSGTKDTDLFDNSCNLLATVTAKFAASLKLEGTGRLSDGRLLNYDGACSCPTSPCYLVADAAHPWGYGVQGRALVPFRSFAVDPAEIAYGTPLYVPELDGVTMPGEAPWGAFVHDGCVSADDTGGAIVGKHVDWFVALRTGYQSLDATLGLSSVSVREGGTRCP
jgi:3D (Asp-Asp-Asp) domain-containing protein